jgi:hypothetical protein
MMKVIGKRVIIPVTKKKQRTYKIVMIKKMGKTRRAPKQRTF